MNTDQFTLADVFCPECGAEIIKMAEFFSCPNGHGKLKNLRKPIPRLTKITSRMFRDHTLPHLPIAEQDGRSEQFRIAGIPGRFTKGERFKYDRTRQPGRICAVVARVGRSIFCFEREV